MPRNVFDAVNPPRVPKTEIQPLDAGQVKRLLNTAMVTQPELYALYTLAVTAGMRSGELLGLQWRDVDLEARRLQVNRTVFNGKVSTPKTAKSRRTIRLAHAAIRALHEHPRNGEWVFSTKAGTSICVHILHNRSWKPLLKRADLPRVAQTSPFVLLLIGNVLPLIMVLIPLSVGVAMLRSGLFDIDVVIN